MGDALGGVEGYVFLDAGPPAPGRSWFQSAPAELTAQLRSMADDGWLPSWPNWWSPHELRKLIPDTDIRERFYAECPRLPVAMFDEVRPPAPSWADRPSGYLRCSEAYQEEAAAARELGWPTLETDSQHLAVLTDPVRIAERLQELAVRLRQ